MKRRDFLKAAGAIVLSRVAYAGVVNYLPVFDDEYIKALDALAAHEKEMLAWEAQREAELERLYNEFWARTGNTTRARWLAQAEYYDTEGREDWGRFMSKTTHDFTECRNGTFAPQWMSKHFSEDRFSRCQVCGMVGVKEQDSQTVLHVVSRWYYFETGYSSGFETFGECVGGSVDV